MESVHSVGPADRTQVIRLGGKYLYLLSSLSSSLVLCYVWVCFFVVLFWDSILLWSPGWSGTHMQTENKIASNLTMILLPPRPEYWD